MKARNFVSCVILFASCFSIRAGDTPDQAAARAALEQRMRQLDQQDARPSPDTNTAKAVTQPAISAPNTPASTAPARTGAVNPPAQAAALAALKQKMDELNQSKALPPPDANIPAANATNLLAPSASAAAAAPVTETPAAEAPAAASPGMAPIEGVLPSAAPAVVSPAPEVSTAPAAAAAVAVVPAIVPGAVATPSENAPAKAPAMPGLPASTPGHARLTNELTTLSGAIYKNVEVERVLVDGIFISYTPTNGGWAMTKIGFSDLPAAIRQQYQKQ